MKKTKMLLVIVLLLTLLIPVGAAQATLNNPNTDWFKDAKYGLFVHYLLSDTTTPNSFDANAFAQDASDAGVGYVIWTLGQNSGYYDSPNSTYNTYTGYAAGTRTSTRDIPNDLYTALNAKGIKLMLYITTLAPRDDTQAANGLGTTVQTSSNWNLTPTFRDRWSQVIQEWSNRYGSKVVGWWFDGAYSANGFDSTYAQAFANAAKSGNANSIVAFNPGIVIDKLTDYGDYAAGEQNDFGALPSSRWINGNQWHVLSFLASTWGGWDGSAPRYSNQQMIDYINNVNAGGGVVTMDVPLSPTYFTGSNIKPAFLDQLKAIKSAIRGVPTGYTFCALENQTCSFSGTKSVAYGANGLFNYQTITTSTSCSNSVFGDPISGVGKSCYYQVSGPAITDDLNDWSKTFSHTANLSFDGANPSHLGGDTSRASRTTSTYENIVYYSGSGNTMTSFSTDTWFWPSEAVVDFNIYSSPDNSTYTAFTPTKTTCTTCSTWTKVTYSGNPPAGTKYIKIEFRNTSGNSWNPQIGKVTYTVSSPTITDNLNDWSKTFSHTANLSFDGANPSHLGGDTSRASRTTGTYENVVYSSGSGNTMAAFSADTWFWPSEAVVDFNIYTSPNNSTYTAFTPTKTTCTTCSTWTKVTYSGNPPAGTKYIKIEFRNTSTNYWNPQIGTVSYNIQ